MTVLDELREERLDLPFISGRGVEASKWKR